VLDGRRQAVIVKELLVIVVAPLEKQGDTPVRGHSPMLAAISAPSHPYWTRILSIELPM
jgi:hypothetical protein